MGRIESSLDTIKQTLSEDRLSSAQYRTEMRKEQKEQNERLGHIESKQQEMADDMSEIKPKVMNLEADRLMSKGARNLAIVLGRFAHVVSAALGGIVAIFVEKWLHR